MPVLVTTKGAGADEEKATPTAEMFEQMRAYNEQLVNAGIMLGGDELQRGRAAPCSQHERTVSDRTTQRFDPAVRGAL